MTDNNIERERKILREAEAKGGFSKLKAYTRLSGPGWLQSAITLGGGSLSTSLFLGVLGGVSLLWIQPLAMILGIIMLAAISYVTLSTGEKPFQLVNRHFNPVIGWGWIIATMLANIIWSLPQYSLGTAALTRNLLPGLSPTVAAGSMLVLAIIIIWFYDTGSKGIRIFENLLKVMVALIVLSFIGVVIKMSGTEQGLDWGAILGGFIPSASQLTTPAPTFDVHVTALAESARSFWVSEIVTAQRGVIFSGVTYAVGINMTFLLPCSQLAKGWDRDFRGLATFDLGTSLLIPFFLATSCIVIAASNQFHTVPEKGLITAIDPATDAVVLTDAESANDSLKGPYENLLSKRLRDTGVDVGSLDDDAKARAFAQLPLEEKRMAAMLVKRGALSLATSLEPLMGKTFSNYVFGFGVFAMTLSSIIILMLINGFTLCEMLGLPDTGVWHRVGCMMPCIGVLGPFIWKDASFWVVVPTATIGLVALPLAYLSFFVLFNNKELLGDALITGKRRVVFNALMIFAILFVSFGCVWAAYDKAGNMGIIGIAVFVSLAVVVHFTRSRPEPAND